jgi:hypothetical protein
MSRVSTPPTAKPVTPPPQAQAQIAHERIAKRAYEKWMKRGCPQGTAFQDWVEAEAELVAEASRGTSNTSPGRR